MNSYADLKSDMHIHTLASDGNLKVSEVIELAKECGLNSISITDHDSIKAYKDKTDYIKIAENYGIKLITGIEMDSEYNGTEVHVLGYGFDAKDRELNEFLENVKKQRKTRITEQIDKINDFFKMRIINDREIFTEERDTYMKPHLILTMLKTEKFKDWKYRDVKNWLSENIKIESEIVKPDSKDIVRMLKKAGAKVFLAHPGYYLYYKSLNLDKLIVELKNEGLDGLELLYPYTDEGTEIDRKSEIELIEKLKLYVKKCSLSISRGSDSHNDKRFLSFNY